MARPERRSTEARRPSAPSAHLETELKFRAASAAPLHRLSRRRTLGPARLVAGETFREEDRYLDTPDGRLAREGWACRLRSRGQTTIVSLKGLPAAVSGPLHRRPEVEGPATRSLDPAAWPRSPARSLVLEMADGGPLRERLVLRQRRRQREVRVGERCIGILTIDGVSVESLGRVRGRLYVVELEIDADAPVDVTTLEELAAALGEVDGLGPDPQSKLERALDVLSR